jgi:hypothetical protein
MRSVIYFLIFSSLFTFLSIKAYNQNVTDSTKTETTDFSFIMLNASYTNNNLEYLTGVTEKIPTLFTNLMFAHKLGIYLGGSYANYFNTDIQSFEYNINAGFQKYYDNGFDFDLGYSYHNYEGDTLLEGLNYDHSVNLSGGIDIGKLYLSGDISYIHSKTDNYFLDFSLSRSITIAGLLFKNDVLLINPSVSLSFGTDYWIYQDMTPLEKYSTAISLRMDGYSINSFSYEGFDFFIPVSYGINSTYLTFSWLYRIPGNKFKSLGWENQSGIMISLTYFLNFTN